VPHPSTPIISVILPYRDAEATIEAAVSSLLAQTLCDIEILAVDDRSSDGGPALVERIARADPRVRPICSDAPHGVVAAVNSAWGLCKAEFIARMDADDVSLPSRLEKQLALLHSRPELSGASCQVAVPGAREGFQRYLDWSNGLTEPEDILRERFVECPVVNPTMLVRKEAVEQVGGHLDSEWAEDYDLWLRFLAAGHKIAKVSDRALYVWSDDQADRLTRSDERYSETNFLRARAHYLAQLPDAGRGFALCGAGPIGKRLARFLTDEGARVDRFYDVNQKRVGEAIHGIPVEPGSPLPGPESKPDPKDIPLLLSCVGSPGGRDRVRALAKDAGYTEGSDFYCCG